MSQSEGSVSPAAFEVYRVEVRRSSVPRRVWSWLVTLFQASGMESTTPPWRDEALVVDVASGRVARVVRNLVGGDADDVGQVALDVRELSLAAFERLWLPDVADAAGPPDPQTA